MIGPGRRRAAVGAGGAAWAAAALWLAAPKALAQPFDPPAQTNVRERIAGSLLSAPGAPAPAAGDQLLAFFNDTLIGVHTFTSDQEDPRAFELLLVGDDPNTEVVEGPRRGQQVQLRFFDASTNFVRTDVAALNEDGEVFNLTFQGQEVIAITDPDGNPLPIPIDLTPRRTLDAVIGQSAGAPGGGGGGGGGQDGGAGGASFDVDGDGKVTRRDAAVVLRLVIGARRAVSDEEAARADVNGDGVVDTRDAVAILKSRR